MQPYYRVVGGKRGDLVKIRTHQGNQYYFIKDSTVSRPQGQDVLLLEASSGDKWFLRSEEGRCYLLDLPNEDGHREYITELETEPL